MDKVLVYIDGVPELVDKKKVRYINSEKIHRPSKEGPAICWPDGSEEYYEHGKLHREDGPSKIHTNGRKEYWVNGQRHRIGGPAVECLNGYKEYWVNGELHRLDGPAVIMADRKKKYFINGKEYAYETWLMVKSEINQSKKSKKMVKNG